MKRTVFIEIILIISTIIAIITSTILFRNAFYYYNEWVVFAGQFDNTTMNEIYSLYNFHITYAILAIFGALCTIASMVMLAIKDFPVFAPMIERRKKKKAERKERHKKKRITELEKQLNELKKDGN